MPGRVSVVVEACRGRLPVRSAKQTDPPGPVCPGVPSCARWRSRIHHGGRREAPRRGQAGRPGRGARQAGPSGTCGTGGQRPRCRSRVLPRPAPPARPLRAPAPCPRPAGRGRSRASRPPPPGCGGHCRRLGQEAQRGGRRRRDRTARRRGNTSAALRSGLDASAGAPHFPTPGLLPSRLQPHFQAPGKQQGLYYTTTSGTAMQFTHRRDSQDQTQLSHAWVMHRLVLCGSLASEGCNCSRLAAHVVLSCTGSNCTLSSSGLRQAWEPGSRFFLFKT